MLSGMNNKKLSHILQFLSIFLLSVLIPIILVANLKGFYLGEFRRLDVYSQFLNHPQLEVEEKLGEVLAYIQFRTPELNEFFSTEDRLHMEDVRGLFLLAYATIIISFIFAFANKHSSTKVSKVANYFSIYFVLIIFLANLFFSFDKLFVLFHQVFFRNDYWLLDPSTSNLIKLFPQEIFVKQAAFIGLTIIVISIVSLVRGYKNEKKQQKEK